MPKATLVGFSVNGESFGLEDHVEYELARVPPVFENRVGDDGVETSVEVTPARFETDSEALARVLRNELEVTNWEAAQLNYARISVEFTIRGSVEVELDDSDLEGFADENDLYRELSYNALLPYYGLRGGPLNDEFEAAARDAARDPYMTEVEMDNFTIEATE